MKSLINSLSSSLVLENSAPFYYPILMTTLTVIHLPQTTLNQRAKNQVFRLKRKPKNVNIYIYTLQNPTTSHHTTKTQPSIFIILWKKNTLNFITGTTIKTKIKPKKTYPHFSLCETSNWLYTLSKKTDSADHICWVWKWNNRRQSLSLPDKKSYPYYLEERLAEQKLEECCCCCCCPFISDYRLTDSPYH